MGAASIPLRPRAEVNPTLGAIRARQALVLAQVRHFHHAVRQETDRVLLLGLIEDIVGRLRSKFAAEERYLRAAKHPGYYAHCQAHRRLLAQLALDCQLLAKSDPLPAAQIRHLFDSYLIHQAMTEFDFPERPRNLGSLARSVFAAMVPAETALATPGVRKLETMGVAQ